jgi:hypothetical protein
MVYRVFHGGPPGDKEMMVKRMLVLSDMEFVCTWWRRRPAWR